MGEILSSEGFSKKKSVNVKELFPVPMHNFSQKTVSVRPTQPSHEFIRDMDDGHKEVASQQYIAPVHKPTQSGALSITSAKVSRPMTAYYSTRLGSASSKPGAFMRNAKLSERLSTGTNHRFKEGTTLLDEIDEAEMQIDWFERNNIDTKKQNRYAKINLDEAYNYKERFAQHLAQKKEKIESVSHRPRLTVIKQSSSPTSQQSPSGSKLHQPSTNRSQKKHMQHSHNVSNRINAL